jgi:hypothetical protein
MGTKKIRLIWAALLGLSRVLPAAATDYQASDYLPLAVGNSWTYQHIYHDIHDPRAKEKWSTYIAQRPEIPQFTIEVLRTEVIAGKTYYVISDMPANWPPAPPHFIAGKKLRWQGTHLMERTTDGEQALYRFDGTDEIGYAVSTDADADRVTVKSRPEPVPEYSFYFHGDYESHGGHGGIQMISFLAGYGLDIGGWNIMRGDTRVFVNDVRSRRAVIGGTSIEYKDALIPTASSASPSSWGQVKHSLLVQSPEGRTNR